MVNIVKGLTMKEKKEVEECLYDLDSSKEVTS